MSFFSMMQAKTSQKTLIGKSIARTASVQITDPSAASFIADGEIVVLNYQDVSLTPGQTITDSPFIRIVQRSGATAATAELRFTPRIDGQGVLKYNGVSGVAGQEQIHVVGFDNTSGSIDATATSRFLTIGYKFDDVIWSEQQNRKVYPSNKTTQVGIVDDIAPLINQDGLNALVGGPASSGYISCEVLTDSTITAFAGTATVSKGSQFVTVTLTTAMVVGDHLRIGTATTGPVYKLVAINGLVLTLDQPFQGASAAGVNVDRITAANALTGNWGMRLTGLALTFSMLPYSDVPFMKTAWDTFIDGWGATTLTKTQEMTFGLGVSQQVANLELMSNIFSGAQFVWTVPLPSTTIDTVQGTLYDNIFIDHVNISDLGVVSGTKPSEAQVYLFMVNDASQTTDILAQLDPWMNSTPRAFPNIGAL